MKVPIKNEPVEAPAVHPEIIETERELAKVDEGLSQLVRVLKQRYSPEKVADMLGEMCEANDMKVDKDGGEHFNPDWQTRVKGWDRLTAMLGYTKKDATPVESGATKIVFNIVQNTGELGGKPA